MKWRGLILVFFAGEDCDEKKTLIFAALIISLPSTAVYATHLDYAVLFSGGYNAENNHDRYYDETLRMWSITTALLGFDVANVYVLFADGTDPAIDRSSNINSDWSSITNAGGNITDATSNSLSNEGVNKSV